MAAVLNRPIMQLTYPVFINGEKQPEIGPKFFLSALGSRSKLPIFIHYNGINHYNTFVPKAWPAATAKPISKPNGVSAMGGMFAGLDDGPSTMQRQNNPS